jgi:hypothetical protein
MYTDVPSWDDYAPFHHVLEQYGAASNAQQHNTKTYET